MSKVGIQVGDRVRVTLRSQPAFSGTVKYTPQAEGDAWVIWKDDLTVWSVQNYETMVVLNRKACSADPVKGM